MAGRLQTPILAPHETKELVRMVKVSIRVGSGAARLDVAVLAESAEQAVGRDHGAMEAYRDSNIYRGMWANPHFENVTVTDFAGVESATRVTRGPVGVAENTKGTTR